jgi:hypothetical protein
MPLAAPPRLIGDQQPRYLIKPPSFSNGAVEVIELAASVGLVLDPWQRLCIDAGLGEDELSELAAFLVAIMVQRQNGKGGITDALELGWLFLSGDRKIIHSAHRADTATGAFRRVKALIDGSYDLSRRVKRMNESSGEAFIELMNGQICEYRTRGRDGGRGLSAGKLVLDEALEMALEVMADLLPTLLAIDGSQVWLTSTPPKLYGQYLTQLRGRMLAGDVANRAYVEWSNPAGADLSDPRVLAKANPALGYRLTLAKLQVLLDELGPELFALECGGIWPEEEEAGWAVIPKAAWLDARVSADSQIVGRPAFGVKVAFDRSCAAIVAAGAREDGGRQVELTVNADGVVDFRPGTAWVVPRLKELEKHGPSVLIIDDKAIADEAETAKLVVHRATAADVATGHALLCDGVAGADVAGRDVHHLDQFDLTAAVRGGGERKIGTSGKAWAGIDPAVQVAPAEAADLALFGHSTPRVHRPVQNRIPLAAYA